MNFAIICLLGIELESFRGSSSSQIGVRICVSPIHFISWKSSFSCSSWGIRTFQIQRGVILKRNFKTLDQNF